MSKIVTYLFREATIYHIRTKDVGKPLNDYYTDILNHVQETGDSKLKYMVL